MRALCFSPLTDPAHAGGAPTTLISRPEASIAIVGARAEAALSTAWWAELLEACGRPTGR